PLIPASEVAWQRNSTASGGAPDDGFAVARTVGAPFTSSGAVSAQSSAPPTAPTPPPIAAASRRSSRLSEPWCQFDAMPPPTAPRPPPIRAHTTGVAFPNVSWKLAQPEPAASRTTETRVVSRFILALPPEGLGSCAENRRTHASRAQVDPARPHHDGICT